MDRAYSFLAGSLGDYRINRILEVKGPPLPSAERLQIVSGLAPVSGIWTLRGVTSYERYVTADERATLSAIQPPLGRPDATHAALIPIRKSEVWWRLPQDRRRAIFEGRSAHIATGVKYLPAIARRLHHSYDLGEPFDFLTWFEFAPADEAAFDDLLRRLRSTEEWSYVEREVDVRVTRA